MTKTTSNEQTPKSVVNSVSANAVEYEFEHVPLLQSPETKNGSNRHTLDQTIDYSRTRWRHPIFGKFAIVCYVIGYANNLIFPELFLAYGGLSFFIPLIFSYVFIGAPTFLIELVVGQYSALSVQRIFARVAPLLSSIGGATSMIFIYRSLFYFPFMAQMSHMFIASLKAGFNYDTSMLKCPQEMNDSRCVSLSTILKCEHFWQGIEIDVLNMTEECYAAYNLVFPLDDSTKTMTTPQTAYFMDVVSRRGFIVEEAPFAPGPPIVVYSMMVLWIIAAGISMGGVTSLGWYCSIFSTVQFLSSIIFAIYAACIKGGLHSFYNFNQFDGKKLLNYDTWIYAISTTLYSLSLADGGIIHIAAHNNFDNNFMIDFSVGVIADLLMTLINTFCTVLSGAWITNKLYANSMSADLLKMPPLGDNFAIIAFPEMASTQSGGMIIVCLYYFNMITIGLSTMTIGLDMLVNAFTDKYHIKNIFYKIQITVVISLILCGLNLFMVTPGGIFFTRQISMIGVKLLVMVALLELIALVYLYGYINFNRNIEAMLGWRSVFAHYLEYAMWKGVAPIILFFVFIGQFYNSIDAEVATLTYKLPMIMKGWTIVVLLSALFLIPLSVVMKVVQLKRQNRNIRVLFQPSHEWKRIDNYEEKSARKITFDTVF